MKCKDLLDALHQQNLMVFQIVIKACNCDRFSKYLAATLCRFF